MASPKSLNVGLMGYGFSTKSFHLPFISPNPDLNVYAFLQRAEAPKDKSGVGPGQHCTIDYPNAKHYRTADEFFDDGNIDLVIVCTHHDTHAEFAERALESGKHVVVEKPFTRDCDEADRVIAAAKDSGKILTVFQNRRYDSDFRTLRHLLSTQAPGPITEAEIHYDLDSPPWISSWTSAGWSPGDGMLYGLGSHTFDQALLLFGTPHSVTGFYRSLRPGIEGGSGSATDDSFTVLLQYAHSPLLVTVKTSVVAVMRMPLKYLVRGRKGSWVKFGEDVQERQVAQGLAAEADGFGEESEEAWGELTTKTQIDPGQRRVGDGEGGMWVGKVQGLPGDYAGFYRDLVAAIRGDREIEVRPEEARDGLRVIELARKSADEKRTLLFE